MICIFRKAKLAVQESIVWPMSSPDSYRRLRITPPPGLLLYGPPGTGKTLLARAAACEVGASLLALKVADVIRGEVRGRGVDGKTGLNASAAPSFCDAGRCS
jgi:ATP-dependent 26S proteasome regulatory subunit